MSPIIIREAATLVLIRKHQGQNEVLMGKRSLEAKFMPGYYVFPGGGVDEEDYQGPPVHLSSICKERLKKSGAPAEAYARAALREVFEETGFRVSESTKLTYFCRAITPPTRVRRFDAHFFMAILDECRFEAFKGDGEITDIGWYPINALPSLPMALITQAVLSVFESQMKHSFPPQTVPFFDNTHVPSVFREIP